MVSATYILDLFIGSFVLGSMYALLAIGMSIIYGILRLINFAHGAMLMVGAYFYIMFLAMGLDPILSLPLSMALGAVLGVAIDFFAYRPLRGGPELSMLITSLGVYIFLENLVRIIATPQPRVFPLPEFLKGVYRYGDFSVRVIEIFTIVSTLILFAALVLFFTKTKVGIAMRATADDLEASVLMGIDANRIIMIAFALASMVAALTGFLWGGMYGQVDPTTGFMPGVKAFIAAVVGGIGSLTGSVLGGYILGYAEIYSVGLLPPEYSGLRDGISFLILIIILLIRPYGLFGREVERV